MNEASRLRPNVRGSRLVIRVDGTAALFRCPACGKVARPGRDFLCPACWSQLPEASRAALQVVGDGRGLERLRLLLEACRAGTPTKEIRIACYQPLSW